MIGTGLYKLVLPFFNHWHCVWLLNSTFLHFHHYWFPFIFSNWEAEVIWIWTIGFFQSFNFRCLIFVAKYIFQVPNIRCQIYIFFVIFTFLRIPSPFDSWDWGNTCHQFLQYFILHQLWIADLKYVQNDSIYWRIIFGK